MGSKMMIASCVLLALFVDVSLAEFCETGFTYDWTYELCTHTISGNPTSTTDYCLAVNTGSQPQVIGGVEMCTMGAIGGQGGTGMGAGGMPPPPPGRR